MNCSLRGIHIRYQCQRIRIRRDNLSNVASFVDNDFAQQKKKTLNVKVFITSIPLQFYLLNGKK